MTHSLHVKRAIPALNPVLILTWRDVHGLRMDEGEEEDVGTLLLVLVESRLPIGIGLETFVIVVSEKDVDSHHLANKNAENVKL